MTVSNWDLYLIPSLETAGLMLDHSERPFAYPDLPK